MKATGRAASGGVGDRGDRTRAGRGGAELEEERPRGALGVNDWYLGYNRPGPRVYADLFSQVKSGDYIEVVALDSAAEERGSLICEVIGQGIDGPTNQSMVYVAVLAGSEPDLMSWAVPNLGAPNAVHLCKGDARDVDLSAADVYLLAVDAWRLRSPDSLTEPWAQAIGEGAALAGGDRPPRAAGHAEGRRHGRDEDGGGDPDRDRRAAGHAEGRRHGRDEERREDRDRRAGRDDTPLREEADDGRRREAGAAGADGGVMGDVRALGAALAEGRRPPREGVD